MTIGMVVVAFMAATVLGLIPVATMMSTPSRTRSAASAGSRSISPSAKRYSMTTFSPTR